MPWRFRQFTALFHLRMTNQHPPTISLPISMCLVYLPSVSVGLQNRDMQYISLSVPALGHGRPFSAVVSSSLRRHLYHALVVRRITVTVTRDVKSLKPITDSAPQHHRISAGVL